jgi:transposase
MNTTTVGIDLAKSIFAVCEGDRRGHGSRSSILKSGEFLKWLRSLPTGTVVAMEACSSAHSWGRTMQALGLEPRLIAAEFVRPYRKNQRIKNDTRDAEAVLTALHAPGMRFVTIKTEDQQQRLAWYRLREGWKAERTALFNRIRGLLTEFGIVVELGAAKIRRKLAELESDTAYPQSIQLMAQSVRAQIGILDQRLAECERQIARQSKSDPAVARLRSRPGIGPLTADAIVATVGNARQFKNGRQFAASLGITPRQHGSGGKTHLGAITRRGDSYLRCLLVQGARCVLQAALRLHKNKPNTLNRLQLWMITLNERVGYLTDPDVPIDTNHLERALRAIPMGRKNWMFCWTELGAKYVGIMHSLIVTCRLHQIDPYDYLVDVLQRVGQHPARRVDELTPRLWKQLFADTPLRSPLHDLG